jgi:hypothetical protein
MLFLKNGQITDYKIYSIAYSAINFDSVETKIKAAEKVLATVIPDIDKFISELSM